MARDSERGGKGYKGDLSAVVFQFLLFLSSSSWVVYPLIHFESLLVYLRASSYLPSHPVPLRSTFVALFFILS